MNWKVYEMQPEALYQTLSPQASEKAKQVKALHTSLTAWVRFLVLTMKGEHQLSKLSSGFYLCAVSTLTCSCVYVYAHKCNT